MADYFQRILDKLGQDLARLEGTATPSAKTDQPETFLTCGQVDALLEKWYETAGEYNFQFDSFPSFRTLSLHLSEQKGCERCRQLYTDLSQEAAQNTAFLLTKLTATARQILTQSRTAVSSLEVWPYLQAQVADHPSYELPPVLFEDALTLKARLILPDAEVEPSENPPAASETAIFSLVLNDKTGRASGAGLTLLLRGAAGEDLWDGQVSAIGRDGRARLANVPLVVLYRTVALVWALHLPVVVGKPQSTFQTRPTKFIQVGFNPAQLVQPLEKMRELYSSAEQTQDLETALAGTRQIAEGELLAEHAPAWGIEVARQPIAEQSVIVAVRANLHPGTTNYYDLLIQIVEAGSIRPALDRRRWLVQLEPDLLQKETSNGQVLFEKLRLPNQSDGQPILNRQLFLWVTDE